MLTKQKSFVSLIFLMLYFVNNPPLQAMERETAALVLNTENDHELDQDPSCLEKAFRCLKITQAPIKEADRLFAQRYLDLNLIPELAQFETLNTVHIKRLMEMVLDIAKALRHGDECTYLDRPDIATKLIEQSRKALLERPHGDNEPGMNKASLEIFFSHLKTLGQDNKTILEFCKAHYNLIGAKNEAVYLDKICRLDESNKLYDSCMKALLIECLNRVDENFKNLDVNLKENYCIEDLICLWRRKCNYEFSTPQKFLMALANAEDITSDEIGSALVIFCLYEVIVFILVLCLIPFLSDHVIHFPKMLGIAACICAACGIFPTAFNSALYCANRRV